MYLDHTTIIGIFLNLFCSFTAFVINNHSALQVASHKFNLFLFDCIFIFTRLFGKRRPEENLDARLSHEIKSMSLKMKWCTQHMAVLFAELDLALFLVFHVAKNYISLPGKFLSEMILPYFI